MARPKPRPTNIDDVLGALPPEQRARVQAALAQAQAKGQNEAFQRGARSVARPTPTRVSHGQRRARVLRPGAAPVQMTADEYERMRTYRRANAARARTLTPQQMGALNVRAAELGMTSRDLWWTLFGS